MKEPKNLNIMDCIDECKVTEFVEWIRLTSDKNEVRITIHIDSEGYEVSSERRAAESLKRSGTSMRNVKGDWIK